VNRFPPPVRGFAWGGDSIRSAAVVNCRVAESVFVPHGPQTTDLDALIEEAMSVHADWVMPRMREGLQ